MTPEKKVKGRKRHLLMDTLGLLLVVVVHAASIQDRDGAELVLEKIPRRFTRLARIWADGGMPVNTQGDLMIEQIFDHCYHKNSL